MSVLYLDASIFVAWLQQGKQDDEKFFRGVSRLVRDIENGKHSVVASTALIVETLNHKNHQLDIGRFDGMSDRFDFFPLDADIARKARQLREQFGVKSLDAIHIATAIQGRADFLCSKDGGMKKHAGKIGEVKIVELPPGY